MHADDYLTAFPDLPQVSQKQWDEAHCSETGFQRSCCFSSISESYEEKCNMKGFGWWLYRQTDRQRRATIKDFNSRFFVEDFLFYSILFTPTFPKSLLTPNPLSCSRPSTKHHALCFLPFIVTTPNPSCFFKTAEREGTTSMSIRLKVFELFVRLPFRFV